MNSFRDLQLKDTRISDGKGYLDGYWKWDINDFYLPAGALVLDISDMIDYCRFHMEEEIPYLTETHKG